MMIRSVDLLFTDGEKSLAGSASWQLRYRVRVPEAVRCTRLVALRAAAVLILAADRLKAGHRTAYSAIQRCLVSRL
jgi:hypothetical protein